jgi:uncharacterized SAM-binding protein YcdF (DUF218 family)
MLYQLIRRLLEPFTLCWLLTLLALVFLWLRCRGERRRLLVLTIPLSLLMLLCVPAVGHLALGSLEWQYPPLESRPAELDAIVVLSGSIRPPDPAAGRPEAGLEQDSLYRCLHAVTLYRQGPPCRVVVSGGHVENRAPEVSCAQVMRDFLIQQGVAAGDILMEDESLTTHENATGCRKLLEPRGMRRIVLVTDVTHLFRAVRCFEKQGFTVTPAGCNYRLSGFGWTISSFLPNPHAAQNCELVFHEWLGVLWYWLNGRI